MSETEFIRSLYRLAETCPQEEFQHQAFESMQQLVQFDGAGWGESAKTSVSLIILRAYMYKISPEFPVELNKVQHLNPLSNLALENPSVTIFGHIDDEVLNVDGETLKIDERLTKIVYKYDVPQALQTIAIHDNELFIYSTGIFRNKKNKLYTEDERQIVERVTPHLFESFRLCRRFDMQKRLIKQWEMNRGVATCDQKGMLHDADDLFVELVKVDWPDWKGAQLPGELTTGLNRNLPYKSKHAFYRWTLLGNLYLLVATVLDKLKELSEREFQIAYNFSNGQTYKEIATQLSIAPATVRNHLASIYTKLDLNSKDKLVKLFE